MWLTEGALDNALVYFLFDLVEIACAYFVLLAIVAHLDGIDTRFPFPSHRLPTLDLVDEIGDEQVVRHLVHEAPPIGFLSLIHFYCRQLNYY